MAVSSSPPIAKSGRNKKIAIKSQKSYKKICKFQKICLTLHPEINNKPTKNIKDYDNLRIDNYKH